MKATDQRREHVAVFGVIVVARSIEIGGHQADRIKAVLELKARFAQVPDDRALVDELIAERREQFCMEDSRPESV